MYSSNRLLRHEKFFSFSFHLLFFHLPLAFFTWWTYWISHIFGKLLVRIHSDTFNCEKGSLLTQLNWKKEKQKKQWFSWFGLFPKLTWTVLWKPRNNSNRTHTHTHKRMYEHIELSTKFDRQLSGEKGKTISLERNRKINRERSLLTSPIKVFRWEITPIKPISKDLT